MPIRGTTGIQPGDITPGRKTGVVFDRNTYARLEHSYSLTRYGHELDITPQSSVVEMHADGSITMTSELERTIQEDGDPNGHVVKISDGVAIDSLKERDRWRSPDDLNGLVTLNRTSDKFMRKNVPAGDTFAKTLGDASLWNGPGTADIPAVSGQSIDIDRVYVTKKTFRSNQGFILRFEVPGNQANSPYLFMRFYWGGPIVAGTYNGGFAERYGAYCLSFFGDGHAELRILSARVAGGAVPVNVWEKVSTFYWARPGDVTSGLHYLRIMHMSPSRPIIEFRSRSFHSAGVFDPSYAPEVGAVGDWKFSHVYAPPERFIRRNPSGNPPHFISGVGAIRYDIRRDLRMDVQVSLVGFLSVNGLYNDGLEHHVLKDRPFELQQPPSRRSGFRIAWDAYTPPGTNAWMRLYDADTDQELTEDTSYVPPPGVTRVRAYLPNVGQKKYYAKLFMTNPVGVPAPYISPDTPFFRGYRVDRDPWVTTSIPGEFTGGFLRSVSVTGAERDPSHESGHIVIEDVRNELPRLKLRGMVPCAVFVTYDPAQENWLYPPPTPPEGVTPNTSILIRGYTSKQSAQRKGTRSSAGMMGGLGTPRAWPNPGWNSFDIPIMGEFAKAAQCITLSRLVFGIDPNLAQVNGNPVPWKVTDVIRGLFRLMGYPESQIDVPDNPQRLFTLPGQSNDVLQLPAGSYPLHFCLQTARDYLGHYLTFDANAGVAGMWRMRPPAIRTLTQDYTSLWNFCDHTRPGPVSAGAPTGARLVTHPKFWAPGSTFIARRGGNTTLRTFVKPPENNSVLVIGIRRNDKEADNDELLTASMINPEAVNAFLSTDGTTPLATANPDSPDYTHGDIVWLVLVDPMIATQEAANWFCRRYYDLACHGVPMASFEAPLVLAVDPNDTNQTRPRPLRYYDPVTITLADGTVTQWLIRNVNPTYVKDHIQMARYELQGSRAYIYGNLY